MNCPKCGKPALPNAVFCKYCGGRLNEPAQPKPAAKFCASCGASLIPQAKFCNICGTRVQEDLCCVVCNSKLAAGSLFCNICGTRVGVSVQDELTVQTEATPATQTKTAVLLPEEPVPEFAPELSPQLSQEPMPESEPEPQPEPVPETGLVPEYEPEPQPEPEPEPVQVALLVPCSACGAALAPDMKFCTVCGAKAMVEFIEEPLATPLEELAFEKAPVEEPAPMQESAAVCASCGAALAPDMKFCTVCGAKATTPEPAETIAEPLATPLEELALKAPVEEPAPISEPAAVCASCGAALVPDMKFCTVCGAKAMTPEPVETIAEPLATPLEELAFEKAPVEEPAPISESAAVCASCGAALVPDMKFCTVCGAKTTVSEAEPMIGQIATMPSALAYEKRPAPAVTGRGQICPSCGADLAPNTTVCSSCNDRAWREKWVQC